MAPSTLLSTGIIVLVYLTIAFGGTFLLRVFSGGFPANDLQKSFFRAGHAHAGVLVTLGLVIRLLLTDPRVPDWSRTLGDFVLWSAILVSAALPVGHRARPAEAERLHRRPVAGRRQPRARTRRRRRRPHHRRNGLSKPA